MNDGGDNPNSGRVGEAGTDHREDLGWLEKRLDYEFSNREYLVRALTHPTFRMEQADVEADNQRLEFLGDAVIGLVVAHELFDRADDIDEGGLSRHHSQLVREPTLAEIARELDLGSYLRLGRGEALSDGHTRDSTLSDATEAVVAAVYLDGGYEAAAAVIDGWIERRLSEALDSPVRHQDFKGQLQELVQGDRAEPPAYRITDQRGPDHDLEFDAEVLVGGEVIAEGTGGSKQSAEQAAAREALDRWVAREIDQDEDD